MEKSVLCSFIFWGKFRFKTETDKHGSKNKKLSVGTMKKSEKIKLNYLIKEGQSSN